MGHDIAELMYDKQEREVFKKRRGELLATGEWSGELNQVRKDGSQVIATSRWTLVKGPDGNSKSILEIHADITDKRLLEMKFLRVQRLESLGILAGGIAHDLNNILAPILLSIQFLRKKWSDPASQKYLETLEKSAHRGADLIKQVLTFARGIEGERVGVNPESLVQEVLTIATQTFPKSIELVTALAGKPWTIVGDVTQLHQVLINLCINARDAMPHGGKLSITVENVVLDETFVKKNPEAKAGVYVLIQVTDSGTGIPAGELDKIFEPFYTTKTLGKGTGLGLSTALGIIRSHNGFILIESKIGSGTTFKVYLPAQLYETLEEESAKQVVYERASGETILLVDDEEPIRETTKIILEDHGYRVITANDGSEAIEAYSRNKATVKVILTDMMMPHLDGLEMVEGLLAIEPNATIIAMTGVPGSNEQKSARQVGITAVLQKPYTEDKLLKVLNEALRQKRIRT
jgi:two-component system, cell cycle sensor histidine kinase and response regulator CckA